LTLVSTSHFEPTGEGFAAWMRGLGRGLWSCPRRRTRWPLPAQRSADRAQRGPRSSRTGAPPRPRPPRARIDPHERPPCRARRTCWRNGSSGAPTDQGTGRSAGRMRRQGPSCGGTTSSSRITPAASPGIFIPPTFVIPSHAAGRLQASASASRSWGIRSLKCSASRVASGPRVRSPRRPGPHPDPLDPRCRPGRRSVRVRLRRAARQEATDRQPPPQDPRRRRLVEGDRRGKWVWYRIVPERLTALRASLAKFVASDLRGVGG
jgi:hypothetical protein